MRQPPEKPRPDFPLFPHASGQWAKKIRGRLHYFGVWADPEAAEANYTRKADDLHAGREPPVGGDALTLRELANHFLTRKKNAVIAREMTSRVWADYDRACGRILDVLGKRKLVADLVPDDFAKLRASAARTLGPVALGNFVRRVRTLFKHAYDARLIAAPVWYGQSFDPPPKRVLRLQKANAAPKMIPAEVLRRLIDAAGPQLRAMILLAINAGLGQADCAQLPRTALARRPGWLDFPRPKTGIARRCPLWPETVQALREATDIRPAPRDPAHAGLVFLTRTGRPWVRYAGMDAKTPGGRTDAVAFEWVKLCRRVGVKVPGAFYTLRAVFRTIADGTKDPVAIDLIMGHADQTMGGVYRQGVDDARLLAVTDHVRQWLWPAKAEKR